MKQKSIFLALGIFLIIPLARLLWFYQGFYQRTSPVVTPEFAQLDINIPEQSISNESKLTLSADNKSILFDTDHDNFFMMSDIEALTEILDDNNVNIIIDNYENSLEDYLKYIDAYVVIAPNQPFSSNEIELIGNFVERGGQILVINDPTRSNYEAYNTSAYLLGIDVTNLLLAPFDIAFQDDYVYNLIQNEGNFQNVYFNDFSKKQPLTDKLTQVVFYGAHSIDTSQTALIRGDKNTLSSITDEGGDLIVAAVTERGKGSVLVLGDIDFLSQSYYRIANNHQLILNIAGFLCSGTRQAALKDIPFLFERPVTLLTDEDTAIDNDWLETLTEIQSYLGNFNLELEISDSPKPDNDLLILGTFPPDSKLEEYLQEFNLEFNIGQNDQDDIFDDSTDEELEPTPEADESEEDLSPENMPVDETPEAEDAAEEIESVDEDLDNTEITDLELESTPTPEEDQDDSDDYTFEDEEETILVPELGEFEARGIGLVLFSSQKDRNTLILLTASTRTLGDFSYNILNYGDLSSCLVEENVAVCSIDSTYADYDDDNEDSDEDNDNGDEDIDLDFFDENDLDDDY